MKYQFAKVALVLVGFSAALGQWQDAGAATINVPDCSLAAVQAAINSAASGDTVAVAAGECTWNGALTVSKAITLRGAGTTTTGGTRILYGGAGHALIRVQGPSNNGAIDVSGFSLVGGDANNWNGNAMTIGGPPGWRNVRIHHNSFENNYPWAVQADTHTYGLIDNNTFRGRSFGMKTYGDGAADWASPLILGTADFLFVESNTFDYNDFYGSTGVPALDMNDGGRVVFRRNTLRYSFFETHDKARSTLVSANAYEVYENTFWTNTNKWKGVDLSAGTGVVWGNTFTGDWTYPVGGMDYKSFDPRSVRLCDGTDPADQNTPGQSGWRCQYQIGTMGEGPSAISYPLYVWNNLLGSTVTGLRCTDGCAHVQSGRDYINNGTTPKPGYAPFTFPHPLASGAPRPAAPTALSAR